MCHRQADDTRTGAEIDHETGIGRLTCKSQCNFCDEFRFRSRNQHTRIHQHIKVPKRPPPHDVLQRLACEAAPHHVVHVKPHALCHQLLERQRKFRGIQARRVLADESSLARVVQCRRGIGEHFAPRAHSLPTCLASCSA